MTEILTKLIIKFFAIIVIKHYELYSAINFIISTVIA